MVENKRKNDEDMLDDYFNKGSCVMCGKLLKDHTDKEIDKCIEEMRIEENEAEAMCEQEDDW
jgi:hypothetical protein